MLFFLLPASPVLGVWFYCFTNGTPCFLRVQFLTPFRGSPYLVLLGVRLTVLGHKLEKYEGSEKLSGRPPTVAIITLLIAYRQLRTQNTKKHRNLNSLLLKTLKPLKLRTFAKISIFLNFGISFLFWYETSYPKTIRNFLFCKGVSKRTINCTSIRIEISRQTVDI